MNVKLLKADLADSERVLELQKICFAPHLERYQDFDTNPACASIDDIRWQIQYENFYKILYDDIWVGSINIQILDEAGNYKLRTINVLPEYQAKGIGQTAIKIAESMFSDAKTWVLETLEDMPDNRHVYEKVGYEFTGVTEKINDRLTLVFYKKTIQA
jgi:GNAT superfamily N-acetyltransferase